MFGVIGDLHIGVRGNNEHVYNALFEFLCDDYIPQLKERKIDVVVQTGDYFDNRSSIPLLAMKRGLEIAKLFTDNGIALVVLVGNHDCLYKTTNSINSPSSIIGYIPGVSVIEEPTHVTLGGNSVAIVPWVNDENVQDVQNFLATSDSNICIGHFELSGFPFNNHVMNEHEPYKLDLSGFEHVISGHFHKPSSDKNITYVGIPTPYTFADVGNELGAYVFNGEKLELIKNTRSVFAVLDEPTTDFGDAKYVKYVNISSDDAKKLRKSLAKFDDVQSEIVTVEDCDNDFDDVDMDLNTDILSLIKDSVDEHILTAIQSRANQ